MKKSTLPNWVPWLTFLLLLIGLFFIQELKIQSAIVTASADPKTEVLISLITNLEAETAALEDRLALLAR